MNFATEYLLLAARKYYGKIRKIEDADIRLPQGTEYFESSGQDASDFIKGKLLASGPFMAARLGAVELNCLLTYHSIRQDAPGWDKCIRFIRHEIHPFWWSKKVRKSMANNAGFFPVSESALSGSATGCSPIYANSMSWVPGCAGSRCSGNIFRMP